MRLADSEPETHFQSSLGICRHEYDRRQMLMNIHSSEATAKHIRRYEQQYLIGNTVTGLVDVLFTCTQCTERTSI